ncbi:hypothetical protein Pfo_028961 [Paulownia fortunei]|nr:hypothetical protein Pfo_028961 [Paulownia fortunei]
MNSSSEGGGGGGASNGGILYHEVQESKLWAFFSEFDLAALASDLDRTERQMMLGSVTGDFLPELSHNVSLDGDFSIQVYVPYSQQSTLAPFCEEAFVMTRRFFKSFGSVGFASHSPGHTRAPLKFYLSAYLDSLKSFGWSIFLVRGNFPKECPITSSEASNGYGQWLSPEDAERITKSCNSASRTREGAGQQQLSDPYIQYEEAEMLLDDEDEDLKAAIAASLLDSSPAIETQPSTSEKRKQERQCRKGMKTHGPHGCLLARVQHCTFLYCWAKN